MRPRRETPGNSGARGDLVACCPVPSGLAVSAQVSLGRAMVDFRVSDTERKFDEGRTPADEGASAAAREDFMRRRGASHTREAISGRACRPLGRVKILRFWWIASDEGGPQRFGIIEGRGVL